MSNGDNGPDLKGWGEFIRVSLIPLIAALVLAAGQLMTLWQGKTINDKMNVATEERQATGEKVQEVANKVTEVKHEVVKTKEDVKEVKAAVKPQ